MTAIYQKELKSYFCSMTAYLYYALFLSVSGIYFSVICLNKGYGDYAKYVLSNISFTYIVLIPLLTMRMLAREKERKTDQLLFSLPLSVRSVVLGKYLAAATLLAGSMLICLLQAGILSAYIPVNWNSVLSGTAGFFFLGLCLLAIGTFISARVSGSMTAGAVTFSLILLIMLLPNLYEVLPERARYTCFFAAVVIAAAGVWVYVVTEDARAGAGAAGLGGIMLVLTAYQAPEYFDHGLAGIVSWFSLSERFQEFCEGRFSISSSIFFLSLAALFLYMTVWDIENERRL